MDDKKILGFTKEEIEERNKKDYLENLKEKYTTSIKDSIEKYSTSIQDLMEDLPKQNLVIKQEILKDLQRDLLDDMQSFINEARGLEK